MKPYQFIILVVAAAILFLLFPGVDISFSRLFYQPGEGFFPRGYLPVDILYELVIVIVYGVAGFVLLASLARLIPRLRRLCVRPRVIAFIALSLALGPGLIVNSLLKDNVGRARPFTVAEFGGTKSFSPALVPSDQCPKNCSFVSGHAAGTFFLVTFAFLIGGPRRRRWAMAGALASGAASGLGRIALGAHFLSDVVFAGLIVYAVAWALHDLLLVREIKPPPWLGKLGLKPGLSEPAARAWRAWQRWAATPGGEMILSFAAIALLCLVFIAYLDRPAALWFHRLDAGWHEFFKTLSDLGTAGPYLVITAVAFAALRLAARIGIFKARAGALKAYSMVAAFIFSANLASGILIDLLKVLFGRGRPKLLFRDELYRFDWFRLGDADFHSFPSGHAQTITALMVALFILVPRFGWAYLVIGAAIAISRAVVNAHYMGDIVAGAYAAAVMTVWVHSVFARSGIDLRLSMGGETQRGAKVSWCYRLGLEGRLLGMLCRLAGKTPARSSSRENPRGK